MKLEYILTALVAVCLVLSVYDTAILFGPAYVDKYTEKADIFEVRIEATGHNVTQATTQTEIDSEIVPGGIVNPQYNAVNETIFLQVLQGTVYRLGNTFYAYTGNVTARTETFLSCIPATP